MNAWVVRVSEEEFLAFSARAPNAYRDKCRQITWDPGFFAQVSGGAFRDACSDSGYDVTGVCFYGPCYRDLDRFEVHVAGGHRVYVQTVRGVPTPGAIKANSNGYHEPVRPVTPDSLRGH